jgi:agmatine deiminase
VIGRMVADAERHSCCYLAWAVHAEWGRAASKVKIELSRVIGIIAQYESVRLLVSSDCLDDARQQSFSRCVEIIEAPVDDIWMRDIAPTFGRRGDLPLAIDWNFNGWGSTRKRRARLGDRLAKAAVFGDARVTAPFVAEGGAFITDGRGTVITTRSCLLNKNRNPSFSEVGIENWLSGLGVRRVIWLEGDPLEPITSGHVDGYVMFGEAGQLLVEGENGNDEVANKARARDIETLRSSTDLDGNLFDVKVIAPPRPDAFSKLNELFAPAYLNAYVANGAVIAAKFGDKVRDATARAALQCAFPTREVRMININHIAAGGGGIRCLTQPMPS